ncbi:MAG TPA: riboflavin synthase [Nitrosospira sp.]|nr:riboflavin synthase [Nitrosospira sp.]
MFTGIIEAVGEIRRVQSLEKGKSLSIASGSLDLSDTRIGDSIAVNGVCLTVISLAEREFTVDASLETLNCTEGLDKPEKKVNLERALRLSDRLHGHLVSGHVDGVGEVAGLQPSGESHIVTIEAPSFLSRYIARKGSITVNGVSLTVNRVSGARFEVNLIPHTLVVTNLADLSMGTRVNIEVDMLARYVEQLLGVSRRVDKD